jgi:intracellular multiplication protein IcmJ
VDFFPIILGVRSPTDAEKGNPPRLKSLVEKTLKRDDFTCRFCGFRAKQYQRVVPYPDAGDPPFATACTFCEQCLMLERTGITGAGLLIWLPEIGQAELNHILRAAYVARLKHENEEIAELATRALDALTVRRAEAKKRLGSDDPLLLATIMHEVLTEEERKQAVAKLDGIRLLPPEKHIVRTAKGDVNHFPQIVNYWCSPEGPFAAYLTSKWVEMFKSASTAAGHA